MRNIQSIFSAGFSPASRTAAIHLARTAMAALLILGPAGDISLRADEVAMLPAAVAPAPAAPSAHLQQILFDRDELRVKLDRDASYKVFSLSKPPRLVLEIYNTVPQENPYEAVVENGIVRRIRSAQFKTSPGKVTRVVLDVRRLVPYEARKTGNDILLTLSGTAEAAAGTKDTSGRTAETTGDGFEKAGAASLDAGAPAAAEEAGIEGEASEEVTATATSGRTQRIRKRGSKDLLGSLPSHPVTIDFENADIRDVMRVLSEMSDINIIYGSDITGFLTIHLDEVPFNQAFDTILTMQGLVAQQMGDNVLRVMTPATLSADRSRAVTVYKTFTLNYAKASDVAQHLASIRISPNGKITVDDRTNSLVVTDTTEGLASAERLISELDRKPQQVMIEAKLVEITLSDDLNLGIQWEYSNQKINGNKRRIIGQRDTIAATEMPAGNVNFFDSAAGQSTRGRLPSERGTGVALPGPQEAAITFGFINNTDLLSATLNALATKGLSKVLSAPKVITVNNQQAKIQSGSRIPFASLSVGTGGTVTQNVTFLDVGILLTVTPTISADSRIRLKVKPEVSFPGNTTSLGPEINTRNADTEVMIRDGETLVIGGLIDENTRQNASKVPLLGDIPVLGVFFRSTSDTKRRSELLVFVTPRIIND